MTQKNSHCEGSSTKQSQQMNQIASLEDSFAMTQEKSHCDPALREKQSQQMNQIASLEDPLANGQ